MSDELRLVGPFHVTSGYSKMTRAVLRTALLAGYRVEAVESDYRLSTAYFEHGELKTRRLNQNYSKKRPIPSIQRTEVETALKTKVSPSAPTLFVQFPGQCGGWPEYSQGPRIAWTMVESDRVTREEWRLGLYGVDLLLAPSKFVYDTFQRTAPEQALRLLSLPVDDRIFNTEPSEHEVRARMGDYIFLSVFNTRERKQWRMMMQAFAEEFGEDESVSLVVRPSGYADVAELANWLNEAKSARRIYVIDKWISDEQLAAWYRRANCYVLPSCEGFGLPFVEAGLCGTPSIALNDGGSADVVNEATGWLIPSKREPLYGNLPHVYDSTHRFAVPASFDAVRAAFRRAHTEGGKQDAALAAAAQFTPRQADRRAQNGN